MIKAKMTQLKNKFWFRLFIKVGIIFVAFVLLLTLCNTIFLEGYYEYTRKKELQSVSTNIKKADLTLAEEMVDIISDIEEGHGFEVEIYSSDGRTMYSSSGGQMMDYFFGKKENFFMSHRRLTPIKSEVLSDGSVLERAVDKPTGNEYLVYRFSLENSATGEVRAQIAQIKNSARTANRFITIIAVFFLILSLFWVFWFSRKISKPISEMNHITRKMASLDFNEKLFTNSDDEIGQLANSINHLSSRLDHTLKELNETNAQLKDEIELEHQLDVMRRGFVADVSHELKTPIAIIQGYAEGLKLDINSNSREKYLDTIIDESHRMNRLVLSILNLSKYESGQVPLSLSEFSLSQLIKVRSERIFDSKKQIYLVFDFDEDITVYSDSDKIDQILKSYLENAYCHANDGGEVKITVTPKENKYLVSVFNSGSHVDEEIMPRIWQSFFRGDSSHNRESGRFGLGLSIVSAIQKMLDEDCGVYNTDDGVCFWFTVKRAY